MATPPNRKVTFNEEIGTKSVDPNVRSSTDLMAHGDRKPLNQKQSQSLPNLKAKDVTPAPNAYKYDIWNLYKGPSTSFNSRRIDIFQTRRDFSEATPDIRYLKLKRHFKPISYYLSPMDPKVKGVTLKGDRKTLFTEAKQMNALFLFPKLVDRTPGPGAYNIPSTIGHSTLMKRVKHRKQRVTGNTSLSNPSLLSSYNAISQKSVPSSMSSSDQKTSDSSASTSRKSKENYIYYFRNQPGPSLKGRGDVSLHQYQKSGDVLLIKEMENENPAPGAYNIPSSFGTGISFGPARDRYSKLPDIHQTSPRQEASQDSSRKESKAAKVKTNSKQPDKADVSKPLSHFTKLPDIGEQVNVVHT